MTMWLEALFGKTGPSILTTWIFIYPLLNAISHPKTSALSGASNTNGNQERNITS